MSALRHLWGRRHESPGLVLLALGTITTLVIWPFVDVYLRAIGLGIPMRFPDFSVYTTAADRWLAGGEIYLRDSSGGFHGSYLYPPVTLLLFYPFHGLDYHVGGLVFGSLSVGLLWLALLGVCQVLDIELAWWEALFLLPATLGFQPALRDFKWGQLSTYLAALLCLAFVAQERGAASRPADDTLGSRFEPVWGVASGVLTTLASSFKLFFATSGAHLLRDRTRFLGAIGTALALIVLSIAIFGVETHQTYLAVLRWGKGWGARPPYTWDQSAAYYPLAMFGALEVAVRVLGILALVVLALATRGTTGPGVRRSTFALGVAAIPLLAPRADIHDLVVLLLPALILLAGELDRPDGHPAIPVLAVFLLHVHRYVLEVFVRPAPWVPFSAYSDLLAIWLQPAMWATMLLVGLGAVRVLGLTSLGSVPLVSAALES